MEHKTRGLKLLFLRPPQNDRESRLLYITAFACPSVQHLAKLVSYCTDGDRLPTMTTHQNQQRNTTIQKLPSMLIELHY